MCSNYPRALEGAGDLPHTDEVISIAREQSGAIGGPGQRHTLRISGTLALVEEFRAMEI